MAEIRGYIKKSHKEGDITVIDEMEIIDLAIGPEELFKIRELKKLERKG